MAIKFIAPTGSKYSSGSMTNMITLFQSISQALSGPDSVGLLRVPNSNPGGGQPWDSNQLPVSGGYTNWSAVTPSDITWSGGIRQKYEVFKLPGAFVDNDIPIYIKIWYGTIYVNLNYVYPVIHASVGTGVGVSTITGPGSSLYYQILNTYNAGIGDTQMSQFISCDNFGLAMALGVPSDLSYNYSSLFVVDRHRSVTNGKPLKTGASIYSIVNDYNTTSVFTNTQLDFVTLAGSATQDSIGHAPCVTAGNLSAVSEQNSGNGQVQFHPWWGVADNSRGPSRMVTTANQANFATPTQTAPEASVNFLGLQSTYKPLTIVPGNVSIAREAGACPAIYWDTNNIATPYDDTP